MNKFCRTLVQNVGHLRMMRQLGQSKFSPALSLIAFDRSHVSPVSASPNLIGARFYMNKRNPNYDFKPREQRSRFPTNDDDDQYADAEPVESVGHEISFEAQSGTNGFAEFGLPELLLKRLDELGYKTPFEIQAATLKHTLEGRDVVGKAFTGSGKTLAFAIPIISRVLKSENREKPTPKCLVLSPTRELCNQLYKAIQELAPNLKCLPIFGGTGYESQIRSLSRGVDIVIATPGRLRDLMQRKNFIPDDIELICLDEADEMLNPNFLDQIEGVIEASRKDKQMLMFSATLNKNVAMLIDEYMKSPILVDLTKGKSQKLPSNIEHYIHRAPEHKHPRLAASCIELFESKRCIIFVNRKTLAFEVSQKLRRSGIRSGDLHSDLSQTKREIILRNFREGKLNVIVATDVASRGLDVPEIDLVIQLEAPPSGVDYYIHRSGRTGRAGRVGKSILIHSGTADTFSRELSRLAKFKSLNLPTEETGSEEVESEEKHNGIIFDSRERTRFKPWEQRSSSDSRYRGPKYGGGRNSMRNDDDDDDNDEWSNDSYKSRRPKGGFEFQSRDRGFSRRGSFDERRSGKSNKDIFDM